MTREEAKHWLEIELKTWEDECKSKHPIKEAFSVAIETLKQEPRKGHWCPQNDDYFDWYECSECGYGSEGEMQYSSEYDVRTNFCPNCGARMVEPQENEETNT